MRCRKVAETLISEMLESGRNLINEMSVCDRYPSEGGAQQGVKPYLIEYGMME